MEKQPCPTPVTDEDESIQPENELFPTSIIDEKEYELKFNNIIYILQIQIDLNYIYFQLFENKEKSQFYYYNTFDLTNIIILLKQPPEINNLNKIMNLLNTAYNNNKLQLSKISNDINIIIKIINNDIEIDCPIKLNETKFDFTEKIKEIIKDINNLKNNDNKLLTYKKIKIIEKILNNHINILEKENYNNKIKINCNNDILKINNNLFNLRFIL